MAGAEGLRIILDRSQKNKIREQALYFIFLAGAEGFEPSNGGTRTRCLTTWRRSNTLQLYREYQKK